MKLLKKLLVLVMCLSMLISTMVIGYADDTSNNTADVDSFEFIPVETSGVRETMYYEYPSFKVGDKIRMTVPDWEVKDVETEVEVEDRDKEGNIVGSHVEVITVQKKYKVGSHEEEYTATKDQNGSLIFVDNSGYTLPCSCSCSASINGKEIVYYGSEIKNLDELAVGSQFSFDVYLNYSDCTLTDSCQGKVTQRNPKYELIDSVLYTDNGSAGIWVTCNSHSKNTSVNVVNTISFSSGKTYSGPYIINCLFGDEYSQNNFSQIILPNNTVEIKHDAIINQKNLKEIAIPKSVTQIGEHALGYYTTGKIRFAQGEGYFCDNYKKVSGFTIKGYAGTAAEKYARTNGFTFVDLTPKPTSIAKASVSNICVKTYTGSAVTQMPVVKLGTTHLVRGIDYSITYSNNIAVGTATMTINGKGAYTGTIKKQFNINPIGFDITHIEGKKKKFVASWPQLTKEHQNTITGFQIQCSTSPKFNKKLKKWSTTKKTAHKYTSPKLKKKKTYYVRIRTYKKIGKKTYYSAWSRTKTVKTK